MILFACASVRARFHVIKMYINITYPKPVNEMSCSFNVR